MCLRVLLLQVRLKQVILQVYNSSEGIDQFKKLSDILKC